MPVTWLGPHCLTALNRLDWVSFFPPYSSSPHPWSEITQHNNRSHLPFLNTASNWHLFIFRIQKTKVPTVKSGSLISLQDNIWRRHSRCVKWLRDWLKETVICTRWHSLFSLVCKCQKHTNYLETQFCRNEQGKSKCFQFIHENTQDNELEEIKATLRMNVSWFKNFTEQQLE